MRRPGTAGHRRAEAARRRIKRRGYCFDWPSAYVVEQARPLNRPDLAVRFNEGPKPPFSYEEIATPEVEQRLRELYAEDYQRLGYLADAASPQPQG